MNTATATIGLSLTNIVPEMTNTRVSNNSDGPETMSVTPTMMLGAVYPGYFSISKEARACESHRPIPRL